MSFVVPILNGERTLDETLASILGQDDGRPFEVVAVDDGSGDGSRAILDRYAADPRVRAVDGPRCGAAAAINTGIRHAAHPIVCQVDQDVIVSPGWMARLARALDEPGVAAAQGRYVPARDEGVWSRVMALDLADRYDGIDGRNVDHVCTGNSAYRVDALRQVGLLDESLGYGYDNDLSYRLAAAGHRLVFCRDATSVHRWREGLGAYLRQQYGFGYGRLDVLARHPRRIMGDQVSGPLMLMHAPLLLLTLCGAALAGLAAATGGPWRTLAAMAALPLGVLVAERLAAGLRSARRYRDPAGLLFVPVHLARDLAWLAAITAWTARRLAGRASRPRESMGPAARRVGALGRQRDAAGSPLSRAGAAAIVPAFNEAESLPLVLDEIHRVAPGVAVIVVDDASTDATRDVLDARRARVVRLSQRLGVGGAVKAGLRYARLLGYDLAVRVDGDGQHDPADIERLLAPIRAGRADAVVGSRFLTNGARELPSVRRLSQWTLARCLSALTGWRVSDPTSGFWAFGPRALKLLESYHPEGYSEPELRLFLSRNGLTVEEVPITMRRRLGGRTSLTLVRTGHALARTVLALVVVPLRAAVKVTPHE